MTGARPLSGLTVRRGGLRMTLAPMVDVLLILIIFFMVTASFRDLDAISLGREGAGAGSEAPSRIVLLRLTAEGHVSLRGGTVAPEGFRALFETLAAADPPQRPMLLTSPLATAQDLARVLDAAGAAGLGDVGLLQPAGAE